MKRVSGLVGAGLLWLGRRGIVFYCSICAESSVNICVYCTKDACANHICERCLSCSDCCKCEFHEGKEPHAMAVDVPGVVTPFFQPYDDAIEAQEAEAQEVLAERESSTADSVPTSEPQTGPEDYPESQPNHSLS